MSPALVPVQRLVSLPPAMAALFAELEGRTAPDWCAAGDPPGAQLGSGGGTAHLLVAAWRATGAGADFATWLAQSRKLVIHGAGESRRLPAYAAVGKPLLPVPVLRWARGQRLTQTLLDLQVPVLERVLEAAPADAAVLVASGDVLLRFPRPLPPLPAVDVLCFGLWATPETAARHGVFFLPRARPGELAFALQKPAPERIRALATEHLFAVDTGLWLLSARAVGVLLARSGWDAARGEFAGGQARRYELYEHFALALGRSPTVPDAEVGALRVAVVVPAGGEFHHLGTSRQMIETVTALQNLELDETRLGMLGAKRPPDLHLQNAPFRAPLRLDRNHTLWVENSTVPATWQLAREHVLTGVPPNTWDLRLEPGVCLDFVPVVGGGLGARVYGLDDAFRGPVDHPGTLWLGRPAPDWFAARGLDPAQAGAAPGTDVFDAPLFPVLPEAAWEPRFLEWLFAARPEANPQFARRWLEAPRLSARALAARADLRALYARRAAHRAAILRPLLENARWSVFPRLDLEATAALYADAGLELPAPLATAEPPAGPGGLDAVHEHMFRSAVLRRRGDAGWAEEERRAFARLRDLIVSEAETAPVTPRCAVHEDQIVWGRCPVRLDLAGGWTDTPPYCLEHGGRVVNFAANLNGQPPVQVFARPAPSPELVLRSIDLGAEQRVRTFAELDTFARPGDEFAVAKAALALAGFLPRFRAGAPFPSLRAQLEDFGGGIELSFLAAVPKGSGLGTSSILAATLLATLSDFCGLGWDRTALFSRTLALEQLLTTGGGWQDQAGGIYPGVKLIETAPGLRQQPTLRWLPDQLLAEACAERRALLYYTGLTRVAKGILQEIVRGLFLNAARHLDLIGRIGENALAAAEALQRADDAALCACVRRSWELNQLLDPGTNPPEVAALLAAVDDYLAAAKLLGAGGGGYLLVLAKDAEAARRARQTLEARPPNRRARFVDLSLSSTGLQVTRS
jgi:galactokinase/mevalonate kinase-like predicted kinase